MFETFFSNMDFLVNPFTKFIKNDNIRAVLAKLNLLSIYKKHHVFYASSSQWKEYCFIWYHK